MKVIIVDDESIVRIALKSMIDWDAHGFQLLGQASDGSRALDLIYEQKPDIVITDIKMPVMDGLDLIRSFSGQNTPRFIVLSSYDDFYLVKEAMKLGAEDYMLKLEIQPENLIDTLKQVSLSIKKQRDTTSKKVSINKQIVKNIGIIRRDFLKDMVNNYYTSKEELKRTMDSLNIQLDADYIYCLTIKISELYRFEGVSHDELFILNSAIINICEEIANDDFNAYCFEGKTGEFFILISSKSHINEKIDREKLLELSERLIVMLEQYLNISPVIGIGEGGRGIVGIQDAFKRSLKAMDQRFFRGDRKVIIGEYEKDGYNKENYKDNYSILTTKETFHKALSLNQKEEIEKIFINIENDISKLFLSRNAINNIIFELFFIVSEFCVLYEIKTQEIMNKSYRNHYQLLHIDSITQAQQWIKEIREDLISYLEKEDEKTYMWHIQRAIEYIESHFNEDISLKEVADQVNLNPSYLSTLLKKYTQMTYSEYITHIRVEKAKKLLLKSSDKVYEIGERVGYSNAYYFNRIFKKITGTTPGQYREIKGIIFNTN